MARSTEPSRQGGIGEGDREVEVGDAALVGEASRLAEHRLGGVEAEDAVRARGEREGGVPGGGADVHDPFAAGQRGHVAQRGEVVAEREHALAGVLRRDLGFAEIADAHGAPFPYS
ncbi:MAG: hypothetical protein U0232_10390 [Thermomicrobiales bacterium]